MSYYEKWRNRDGWSARSVLPLVQYVPQHSKLIDEALTELRKKDPVHVANVLEFVAEELRVAESGEQVA